MTSEKSAEDVLFAFSVEPRHDRRRSGMGSLYFLLHIGPTP
jgi:hypothetical protein